MMTRSTLPSRAIVPMRSHAQQHPSPTHHGRGMLDCWVKISLTATHLAELFWKSHSSQISIPRTLTTQGSDCEVLSNFETWILNLISNLPVISPPYALICLWVFFKRFLSAHHAVFQSFPFGASTLAIASILHSQSFGLFAS
jgi:hypothetical protein